MHWLRCSEPGKGEDKDERPGEKKGEAKKGLEKKDALGEN